MRKTLLATAVAAAAAMPGLASAQASSPHSITGNLSIVSDYRFRGISQTFVQPAIQGGIDYSHKSGFYLGNWNSNVSGASRRTAAAGARPSLLRVSSTAGMSAAVSAVG